MIAHVPPFPTASPFTNTNVSSPYSLLMSLGIVPNFESERNTQIIQSLVSELVSLHKKSNKDINFYHQGNCKPGVLVSIPRAINYETYEKNERKQKWLESIINFVCNNNKKMNASPDQVCSWILRDLHKYYPHNFTQTAEIFLDYMVCKK